MNYFFEEDYELLRKLFLEEKEMESHHFVTNRASSDVEIIKRHDKAVILRFNHGEGDYYRVYAVDGQGFWRKPDFMYIRELKFKSIEDAKALFLILII